MSEMSEMSNEKQEAVAVAHAAADCFRKGGRRGGVK